MKEREKQRESGKIIRKIQTKSGIISLNLTSIGELKVSFVKIQRLVRAVNDSYHLFDFSKISDCDFSILLSLQQKKHTALSVIFRFLKSITCDTKLTSFVNKHPHANFSNSFVVRQLKKTQTASHNFKNFKASTVN